MTLTELKERSNDTKLFYRLPKKLFEDKVLREMSSDAKVLYPEFPEPLH